MTANQATYAAMFALDAASSRRVDPVRARVAGGQQVANAQGNHISPANLHDPLESHRGLHLLPDTRGTGPRGLHPGDVLYWVACLGGAGLLLIMGTT